MRHQHNHFHPYPRYGGLQLAKKYGMERYFPNNGKHSQQSHHGKVTQTFRLIQQQRASQNQYKRTAPFVPAGLWRYRPGMKLGRGVPMSDDEFRALRKGSGSGTFEDPKVLYNTDPLRVSKKLIEQCEALVKTEAKRLGVTCVIIRGDLHNTTRTFDPWSRQVVMVEDPRDPRKMMPLLEPLDDHLTVSFGTVYDDQTMFGCDNIQLNGHIFVNVQRQDEAESWPNQRDFESGLIFPKTLWKMSDDFSDGLATITGKLPPWKRRHIQDGYDECSEEYWERGTALKRNPYNFHLRK